jgi:dienelactone hydrolase
MSDLPVRAPGTRRADAASRARRAAVAVVLVSAALLGTLVLVLLRDPLPHMAERRSSLAVARELDVTTSARVVDTHVELTAGSGLTFDVLVRAPARTFTPPGDSVLPPDELGRRPLFLILGGYRTGEQAAALIDDPRGAIVAAIGYPYDGRMDVSGLEVVPQLPAIRRAILDTPPAVQLALDHLLARPDVDPRRVELVGVSLGAFVTPVAAVLEPRVTRLWLVHGAAQPRAVLEHGLRTHIDADLPRALVAAAANLVFAGPHLAPERWLADLHPRPVVIINASDEERLPPEAVASLYETAREPKELIWVSGAHLHPERPDLVEEIMDVVLSHASRGSR